MTKNNRKRAIDQVNILSLKLKRTLRIFNALIIVVVYKMAGIDWVIIYGLINIDGHLDDVANTLQEVLAKVSKKGTHGRV